MMYAQIFVGGLQHAPERRYADAAAYERQRTGARLAKKVAVRQRALHFVARLARAQVVRKLAHVFYRNVERLFVRCTRNAVRFALRRAKLWRVHGNKLPRRILWDRAV